MPISFMCYNDPPLGGVVYLCQELPDIYGVQVGLADDADEVAKICEWIAKEACGLLGDLESSVEVVDDGGVKVYKVSVTTKEIDQ